MSLWRKITKAFDTGGVRCRIDAPPVFRWGDGTLPVAVQLANTTEEPRLVTGIEVAVTDSTRNYEQGEDRERAGSNPRRYLTYHHDEPIPLEPGEVRTLTLDVPLSAAGLAGAVGDGAELPGWMQKVDGALTGLRGMTEGERWYRLTVKRSVEGAKAGTSTSRDLRHLAPGSRSTVIWAPRFE